MRDWDTLYYFILDAFWYHCLRCTEVFILFFGYSIKAISTLLIGPVIRLLRYEFENCFYLVVDLRVALWISIR